MRGPELFDVDHAFLPPRLPAMRGPGSVPEVLMLAEVAPLRLGPRYHTVVCVRTSRKRGRVSPPALASLDFGLEHSLAAFGVAGLD